MQALSCTGPLIVEDCGSAPYHYDDERILLFQDYFQKTDQQMSDGLVANPFAWPGETRGILLNGKGVSLNQTAIAGPSGEALGLFGSRRFEGCYDQITLSDDCTLPVIDVEPGKTYRFRFIGSTGLSALSMGFEDHSKLTIVQVDGSEYNVPVTVPHIQLGGGQRFDVLFQAKTAEELGDKQIYFFQFETRDRPEVYRGYAVLRYTVDAEIPMAPPSPVVPLPREFNNWNEYTFQPLFPENNYAPTAEEVTRRVTLQVEQKIDQKSGRLVWEISNLAWTEATPQKPVLIDIYERGNAAVPDYIGGVLNYGWDPHTKLYPALVDEVLEIVIQNTGSQFAGDRGIVETHPFHAHGQHYYDIGSGPGLYDADANNAKLAQLGYKAVKRDTTFVFRYGGGRVAPGEPAGWRAWRMRMANPGVWSIHCHILAHMMTGTSRAWWGVDPMVCGVVDADRGGVFPQACSRSGWSATRTRLSRSPCKWAWAILPMAAMRTGTPRIRRTCITSLTTLTTVTCVLLWCRMEVMSWRLECADSRLD